MAVTPTISGRVLKRTAAPGLTPKAPAKSATAGPANIFGDPNRGQPGPNIFGNIMTDLGPVRSTQRPGGGSGQPKKPGAFDEFVRRALDERTEANEQTAADRARALGDLDAIESEIGENVNFLEGQFAADELASNEQAMQQFSQSFAALGRPVSPGSSLKLAKILAAGSTTRVSQRSAELRSDALTQRFNVARQRDDIFRNTRRETISDLDLLRIAKDYGISLGSGARG